MPSIKEPKNFNRPILIFQENFETSENHSDTFGNGSRMRILYPNGSVDHCVNNSIVSDIYKDGWRETKNYNVCTASHSAKYSWEKIKKYAKETGGEAIILGYL